ncbi:uncharacterized protein si:dkey-111e8.4 [Tachysurus fulvidraco]|uniref:uncharacterized protein si:dkey-111e8.4 n=1 Tax=Tachysurus fulvidraco TaxID=1234273 RepID=UPI001FEF6528|nr:uncharacterized protein si:dkey-111e8.4 [Tachysurus fulvidraco]
MHEVMDDTRVSPMSEWLNSDIFIIFVVFLLLTIIAIVTVCCILRRRHTHEKMAEVEIIPSANSSPNNNPRFTLRIITEKKHASEIVQMLTVQTRSTVDAVCTTDPGVSDVHAEVIEISQDQSQIHTLASCHTETDSTLHTAQQATSLNLQTTSVIIHPVPDDETQL